MQETERIEALENSLKEQVELLAKEWAIAEGASRAADQKAKEKWDNLSSLQLQLRLATTMRKIATGELKVDAVSLSVTHGASDK
jgi:phosphopantetheinyl transferase (holo-ACP synthase)